MVPMLSCKYMLYVTCIVKFCPALSSLGSFVVHGTWICLNCRTVNLLFATVSTVHRLRFAPLFEWVVFLTVLNQWSGSEVLGLSPALVMQILKKSEEQRTLEGISLSRMFIFLNL